MPAQDNGVRKRKSHTKSRQGCGNCKMRRVKCDETKPKCEKCVNFGVACDYNSKSDLHFEGVGAFQVEIPKAEIPDPIEQIIERMLNTPLELHVDEGTQGPTQCYLDKPHLDLMRKFQSRTVLTIGTKDTIMVYRNEMVKQAAEHSVLLHAVLRFTLMHDRYIYDPMSTKPSAAEAYHGYHSAALFGKKLMAPLAEFEKDAMWSTAALLGASAFAGTSATCAEEAWPLKPAEFDDLDWLKMSEGKKAVFTLADPLRRTSVFRSVIEIEKNRQNNFEHQPRDPDLDRLFPYVTKLFNLGSPRSKDEEKEDPYFLAASIVERLIPIECNHSTIMWFMSFLGHMEPEYRQLLEEKDPQAILLLAWWYAKLIPYDRWWLSRRALFECQAICLYLDRVLPPAHEIRRLLEFPRSASGLQFRHTDKTPSVAEVIISESEDTHSWKWKVNF